MSNLSVLRLLLLLSLSVTVAVLCLRAYSVLTQDTHSPTLSLAEDKVTGLLETVFGVGEVRVAIRPASPKTYLILVNGDAATVDSDTRDKIETLLVAAQGYAPETDILTIQQYPFATAFTYQLSPSQVGEFLGLLLAIVLQAMGLLFSRETRAPMIDDVRMLAPTPLQSVQQNLSASDSARARPIDTERGQVVRASQQQPEHAVSVLRQWMQSSGGSA